MGDEEERSSPAQAFSASSSSRAQINLQSITVELGRRRAHTTSANGASRDTITLPRLLLDPTRSPSSHHRFARGTRADSEGENGLGRRSGRSPGLGTRDRAPSQGGSSSHLWIPPVWLSNSLRQTSTSFNQKRRMSLPPPPAPPSPSTPRRPRLASPSWSSPSDHLPGPAGLVIPAARSSPREALQYLGGDGFSFQSDHSGEGSSSSDGDPSPGGPATFPTLEERISGPTGLDQGLPLRSFDRAIRLADSESAVWRDRVDGAVEVIEPTLERGLLMDPVAEPRTYRLVIRQAPLNGRASGSGGSKDRRPLDPLPIIQLQIVDKDSEFDPENCAHTSPHLVMRAALKSHPALAETALVSQSEDSDHPTRTLEGKNFASAHVCRDVDGAKACFFIFSDLNVKVEGDFVLCFSLIRLGRPETLTASTVPSSNASVGQVIAEVVSDPFTVFSNKRYPGMTESTPLVKLLAAQNINIPVRNDVRRGRE